MKWLLTWLAVALVFLGLDSIWLTQVSPHLYPPVIGQLLSPTVSFPPAILFYAIYTAGIVALAVEPSRGQSVRAAILRGAVLGFVAYATYDLTNQATLRAWSTLITVADLAWGSFITACAAGAGYFVARKR